MLRSLVGAEMWISDRLESLASAHLQSGHGAEALSAYYHLEYLSEDGSRRYRARQAECHLLNGDYSEACAAFEEASDTGFRHKVLRGISLWLGGHRHESVAFFRNLANENKPDRVLTVLATESRRLSASGQEVFAGSSGLDALAEVLHYDFSGSAPGSII